MFNPVHHNCHPFTDFYKKLTCVEPKPFLTARKSNRLIFWRACLLVVPAGFDPRTYSIRTLHIDPYESDFVFSTPFPRPARSDVGSDFVFIPENQNADASWEFDTEPSVPDPFYTETDFDEFDQYMDGEKQIKKMKTGADMAAPTGTVDRWSIPTTKTIIISNVLNDSKMNTQNICGIFPFIFLRNSHNC